MRVPTTKVKDRLPAFLVSIVAAAMSATPALADAAPIVYKSVSENGRISTERQTVFITPNQTQTSPEKARARVQFNYPGSSTSNSGTRVSSPTSVGGSATPREYASITAPISTAPAPVATATNLPNGFDPRAAAQSTANNRTDQHVVETAPLPAMPETEELEPVEQGADIESTLAPAPGQSQTIKPETVPVFDQTGAATVFGDEFQGLPTANGELFDQSALMAAHPSLPLPSLVQVVNLDTNSEVVVRVNDRGPFEEGAMLQVSERAAAELGMNGAGRANVRVRYLGPAPMTSPKPQPMQVATNTTSSPTLMSPTPVATTFAADRNQMQTYQPVSVGNYFVQVGAFSQISNAESLINTMPASVSAQIDPARVNGADFFRVRVGPFSSRDAADRTRDDLARSGLSNSRVVSQN